MTPHLPAMVVARRQSLSVAEFAPSITTASEPVETKLALVAVMLPVE